MMAKEYTQDSSAVAYIDQVLSGLSEAVKARASNSLAQLVQLSTAIASPSTEPEAVVASVAEELMSNRSSPKNTTQKEESIMSDLTQKARCVSWLCYIQYFTRFSPRNTRRAKEQMMSEAAVKQSGEAHQEGSDGKPRTRKRAQENAAGGRSRRHTRSRK